MLLVFKSVFLFGELKSFGILHVLFVCLFFSFYLPTYF